MEVGTEISQKIRSAIKAKLLELGSYVDDELPDYIMVMVANKKSRSQMNSDLGLFLAANTDAFTEWLHGLLEKLQTITVTLESDKSSVKQGKTDKPKSSKEKKKDKEKSHKVDSSRKKHSQDENGATGNREKKKVPSDNVVSDRITITDKNSSEITAVEKLKETKLVFDENSQEKYVRSEQKPTDSLGTDIGIQKQVIERDKQILEDFEDVRQMLVTETAEDELAVELETTEVEVAKSRTVKNVGKPEVVSSSGISAALASHSARAGQPISKRSHSPQHNTTHESVAPKKRKAPTSVVASVRQKVGEEDEEYDPHNPAFGTVASVVKVTARKSSVPPMLQANRLLLLKAMTEAERSVAVQKKVAVMKPLSRDNSPAEVYSPKRKRSDLSHGQESPPLYFPSRKDCVNRKIDGASSSQQSEPRVLTQNDARHVLNRDSNRELASRSSNENVVKAVGIDRGSSQRQDFSKSSGTSRRLRDDNNEKEVRSDRDMRSDRNFQITRHVSSASALVVESRKRQHSPSPGSNKNLQVTISSVSAKSSQNVAARLGKIIVERKDSQEDSREAISTRSGLLVSSTGQRDAREDIIAKVGKPKSKESINQKFKNSSRVISSLGKEAFQKQCEAAVISVQAAEVSSRTKRNMSPDSRVVECDTQSTEEGKLEENSDQDKRKSKEVKSGSLKGNQSMDVFIVKDKSPVDRAVDDDENDDLSKMIDEDLGPELLDDTNGDEFNLDLDIDEDLSNAIGVSGDETVGTEMIEHGKDEKRSGTKFIVTLDGVDDRHFHTENNNSSIFNQFKHPPNAPSIVAPVALSGPELLHQPLLFPMANRITTEQLQQNHHLYLDFLAAQGRTISQESQQQLQTLVAAVPSKLTPPKIQPFSISLKDSDDEHDDKEGKPSAARQEYYQQSEEDASLKRTKLSERCKFWPACAAGASCEYHHPKAHCKTFPNCKFGDKCLFIHPNCRFDSKCTRADCPYTHTSRRPALAGTTHVITLPPSHFVFSSIPPKPKFVGHPSTQTMCHYFPNCQNINCRFLHPKPCKFGVLCKNSACPFYHNPVPGKDKLKWQAGGAQTKAEITAMPGCVKVEPELEKLIPTVANNSAAVSSTSQ